MQTTPPAKMAWIQVCPDAPYFQTEDGQSWTPIGQNDAMTWPDFEMLYRRKDVARVEGHLAYLAAHGVSCIRMMMEYAQTDQRYLERPFGRFQPAMVQFWDDLFMLCEKYGIRILLTPFDTFWMGKRWKFHPYNQIHGGPCKSKFQWLTSPAMLAGIQNRFTFFIERWGGSGVLFGWDLWNEINPLLAGNSMQHLDNYIHHISKHIRDLEMRLYGKTHLQTVSVLAHLIKKQDLATIAFQHACLDFASTHFYQGTVDYPRSLLSAAVATGRLVQQGLQFPLPPGRPFLDTEHGPITYFRRHRKGMPEVFDDRYFLHMQWAHMASGAAGGGMRWPYRHPHTLTHGMRRAQLNLSSFSKIIDWWKFRSKNLTDLIVHDQKNVHLFGCGDAQQAVIWLLSIPARKVPKIKSASVASLMVLNVPGLEDGDFLVHFWDTITGLTGIQEISKQQHSYLRIQLFLPATNLAIAVRKKVVN